MNADTRTCQQAIDEILRWRHGGIGQGLEIVRTGAQVRVRAGGQQRRQGGNMTFVFGDRRVMLRQPGERRVPTAGAGTHIRVRAGGQQRLHHVDSTGESGIDDGLPVLGCLRLALDRGLKRRQVALRDGVAEGLVGYRHRATRLGLFALPAN